MIAQIIIEEEHILFYKFITKLAIRIIRYGLPRVRFELTSTTYSAS